MLCKIHVLRLRWPPFTPLSCLLLECSSQWFMHVFRSLLHLFPLCKGMQVSGSSIQKEWRMPFRWRQSREFMTRTCFQIPLTSTSVMGLFLPTNFLFFHVSATSWKFAPCRKRGKLPEWLAGLYYAQRLFSSEMHLAKNGAIHYWRLMFLPVISLERRRRTERSASALTNGISESSFTPPHQDSGKKRRH